MGMVSLLRDDVTADAKERCCCGQEMIHRIAATLFGRILHHFISITAPRTPPKDLLQIEVAPMRERATKFVRFTPASGHSAAGQISNIEKLFDRLVDAIE